jgi:putative sigma-54 modulation protein
MAPQDGLEETSAVQVQISTRHGHLSEASQQKIAAKVEKLLRIYDRLTTAEVTVDLKDSANPRVDLKVLVEHQPDFVAHDQSAELMASVDTAVHRLEQQLRKYKEKAQDRHRGADGRRAEAAEPIE